MCTIQKLANVNTAFLLIQSDILQQNRQIIITIFIFFYKAHRWAFIFPFNYQKPRHNTQAQHRVNHGEKKFSVEIIYFQINSFRNERTQRIRFSLLLYIIIKKN